MCVTNLDQGINKTRAEVSTVLQHSLKCIANPEGPIKIIVCSVASFYSNCNWMFFRFT